MIIQRKSKLCSYCGKEFQLYNSLQKYCSYRCRHNAVKEATKRTSKPKEVKKSYAVRVQEARAVFQEYIRLRDKAQSCITCGSIDGPFDAGHYYKAELYTNLIFNEDNVHKQCIICNRVKEGNLTIYKTELIKRIGIERFVNLTKLKRLHGTHRYSTDELREIKTKYLTKIKEHGNNDSN